MLFLTMKALVNELWSQLKCIRVHFVFQIYLPFAFQKNLNSLVWEIDNRWFICMKFLMCYSVPIHIKQILDNKAFSEKKILRKFS